MVKKEISGILFVACFVLVISLVGNVAIADHFVTPTSFSVNQSAYALYNITVNNTDLGFAKSITQVNITVPSTFTFNVTNGSNATATFSNTSVSLIWTNATFVVNGTNSSGDNTNSSKYFWFYATVSIPGSYNIIVNRTNSSGTYATSIPVVVNDTINPVASQGTNPVDSYNSSSENLTFDIKCSDNVAVNTIQLWTNATGVWQVNYTNSSYTNNTWLNVTVSGIPQGNNLKWAVWCSDTAGLTNQTVNLTFLVDTAAPTITLPIYTNATLKKNTNTLTINISVVDSGSGVASPCFIDVNGTNQTIAYSGGWCNGTVALTGLTDGNKTINVYVNDSVGNLALNNNYAVWIDTTNPIASQGTNPVDTYNSSSENITFDINCLDNANVSTIQLWMTNSTGAWLINYTNSSYTNNTWLNITVNGITEKSGYKWAVYCNDSLGSSNYTTNRTFTVDKTAPTVTLVDPENEETLQGNPVSLNYTATDNLDANISTCSLYLNRELNGEVIIDMGNNTNQIFTRTLAYTGYEWIVECCDYAGNCANASSSWDFSVIPASSDGGGGGGGNNGESNENQTQENQTTLNVSVENLTWEDIQKPGKDFAKHGKFGKGEIKNFLFWGENHSIKVVDFGENYVTIEIRSTPISFIVNAGEIKEVDINGDGTNDLIVTYNGIVDGKADITIEQASASQTEEVTCDEGYVLSGNECVKVEIEQKTTNGSLWIWIVVIAVVVFIILWMIIAGLTKKRRR